MYMEAKLNKKLFDAYESLDRIVRKMRAPATTVREYSQMVAKREDAETELRRCLIMLNTYEPVNEKCFSSKLLTALSGMFAVLRAKPPLPARQPVNERG